MNKKLQAALIYAQAGIPVIPMAWEGKQKKPLRKHGDATTDPGVIQAWWGGIPDANVGLMTGKKSGIVVLDVDPRHGGAESLIRLQKEVIQLPLTPKALTGGGGTHYYFLYPAGEEKVKSAPLSKDYPGLDIKADGGIITAPPSTHIETGQLYSWFPTSRPPFAGRQAVPFAPFPPEILAILGKASDLADGPRLEVPERIPEGQRGDTLFRFACLLRRAGLSEDMIFHHLMLENQRCDPPETETNLRNIAKSAGRYDPGVISMRDSQDIQAAAKNEENPFEAKIITDEELRGMNLTPPKPLIRDLLYEGVTFLAAHPKVGKSFLAVQMAQAVALGQRALGALPAEQGDVIYFALEDGPVLMQSRLKLMERSNYGPPMSTPKLRFVFDLPMAARRHPELIASKVLQPEIERTSDLKLIVVDTLARIRPSRRDRNASAYDDDYQLIQPFQDLAKKMRVAVLIVHHLRKGASEDPLEQISGTMGLSGSADAAMLLRRPRGTQEGTVSIFSRFIRDTTLALIFDKDSCLWKIVGQADDGTCSGLYEEILDVIHYSKNGGMSPRQVAAELGRKTDFIRSSLRVMSEKGLVRRTDTGKYQTTGLKASDLDPQEAFNRHVRGCRACMEGAGCSEGARLLELIQAPAVDGRSAQAGRDQ